MIGWYYYHLRQIKSERLNQSNLSLNVLSLGSMSTNDYHMLLGQFMHALSFAQCMIELASKELSFRKIIVG